MQHLVDHLRKEPAHRLFLYAVGLAYLLFGANAIAVRLLHPAAFAPAASLLLLGHAGFACYAGWQTLRFDLRGAKLCYWVTLSCVPVVGIPMLAVFHAGYGPSFYAYISVGSGFSETGWSLNLIYDQVLRFFPIHTTVGVNFVALILALFVKDALNKEAAVVAQPQ